MPTRPATVKSLFQFVCQLFFCYSSGNLLYSARDVVRIGTSEGSPPVDFMSFGIGAFAFSRPLFLTVLG